MRAIAYRSASGAVLLSALAIAFPALAYQTELEAEAGAGPCGGSIGCTHTDDKIVYDAPKSTVLISDENQTIPGAYADAYALTTFGTQKVYADGYNANIATDGYAESKGFSRVEDAISAAQLVGGSHTFYFGITGSHTVVGSTFGAYAFAYFQFLAYDDGTGTLLDNTIWESTDADQTASFAIPIMPKAGDGIQFEVDFEADAYTSSFDYGTLNGPPFVYSDYSHSLDYYVTGKGGLIGVSGHDYAINPLAGVPEPATWVTMLIGVLGIGTAARRRQKAV